MMIVSSSFSHEEHDIVVARACAFYHSWESVKCWLSVLHMWILWLGLSVLLVVLIAVLAAVDRCSNVIDGFIIHENDDLDNDMNLHDHADTIVVLGTSASDHTDTDAWQQQHCSADHCSGSVRNIIVLRENEQKSVDRIKRAITHRSDRVRTVAGKGFGASALLVALADIAVQDAAMFPEHVVLVSPVSSFRQQASRFIGPAAVLLRERFNALGAATTVRRQAKRAPGGLGGATFHVSVGVHDTHVPAIQGERVASILGATVRRHASGYQDIDFWDIVSRNEK